MVAVIEDDEAMRRAIARLLRTEGFAPEVFDTAERFLASGATVRARCLVLDIRLPGMSGVELFRLLRDRGDVIPTVFVSAQDRARLSGLALRGDDDYLAKPFLVEDLIHRVQRAVAG